MRNNSLDAAKIIACFFIVFVHVGGYPEVPAPFGETLRVMTRWAVPFFFLASGYTIIKIDASSILKRVNKLISILFYASLLYIPVVFMQSGYSIIKTINKILSMETIHYGLYGHLWFIGSLVAGLMLFWYSISNMTATHSKVLSVIIIIMCWFGDLIKSFGVEMWFFYTFRYLMGFSLIYIGWAVGSGRFFLFKNIRSAIITLAISLILMGAEYYISLIAFDASHGERQFPLFSIPAALSILYLCDASKIKDCILSELGRSYSLGVYLIHPFIIYFLGKVLGYARISESSVRLIAGFLISILVIYILKKFIPTIYNRLNGVGVK